MPHIAFFGIPGHGHVNPTLPIVAELIRRGHRVSYYNTASFAEKISSTGAQFYAYPATDLTGESLTRLAGNLVDVTVLLLEASQRLLPFALDELRREQPDVVVFDGICLWGMQAAYLLNLPRVSSIATMVLEGVKGVIKPRELPGMILSALPRLPRIRRLRRRLEEQYGQGVFPNKDLFPCVGQKTIVFTSREFQPPTPFIDDSFYFVGPAIDPETRVSTSFPWNSLRAGPRVYVSLGTIHRNDAFFNTVFETFAGYPAQFIVSAGQQTDLAALGDAPDNFLVREAVPQLELLPKTDLFITHGGNNSVHEALYWGVPLLVVPQQTEQVANGRLVAQQGAGIVVGDRPPYHQRISATALRSAVDQLLHDESYRGAAQRLSASFRATGGYRLAADVVESLLPPFA